MVDFNKHSGRFQMCRVCSAVRGSPRYLEEREGGVGVCVGGGARRGEPGLCRLSSLVWFEQGASWPH